MLQFDPLSRPHWCGIRVNNRWVCFIWRNQSFFEAFVIAYVDFSRRYRLILGSSCNIGSFAGRCKVITVQTCAVTLYSHGRLCRWKRGRRQTNITTATNWSTPVAVTSDSVPAYTPICHLWFLHSAEEERNLNIALLNRELIWSKIGVPSVTSIWREA